MSTQPRRLGLALVCALALLNSACVVSPLVTDASGLGLGRVGAATQGQGINPVLQAFTANPMATSDKDAKITFTVVATSPTGAPLQYNWSATKGVLSSNTGQMVYWSPSKADGSLETAGDAQISVIITNASGGSVVGTATVKIMADGSAKVGPIATAPTTKPSTAPSPAPSASATPQPDGDATADTDASGTDISADTDASGTDVSGDTDASGTDISADTDASGTDVSADQTAGGTDA